MKFTIQRDSLVALIARIQGVVPSRAVIPILSNILIEARQRRLIITATDLTVSIRVSAEASIDEEGAITLPAKRFFSLIRELTTPTISLASNADGIALITAGTSHFRVHGMDKDEFPSFPDLAEGKSFTVDGALFKEMLQNTAFAAARDDSRQVLNGILLLLEQGKAIVVGTDGKRLAKIQKNIETEETGKFSSVIPLKAVEEMIKLLDDKQKAVVTLMSDKIALECFGVCLVSKLIAGQFPDYERVIPSETNMEKITLHREELMTLLKQVSLFTSDLSHSVKFTFEKGELKLQATSHDIGEGNVNMPVDYSNKRIDIAFNPHYFLDILRHCKDETVSVGVSDSFNPGSITDSGGAHYVLMPMRLSNE